MVTKTKGKIGVFDSGFGGLAILKEIVKELPSYDFIYLGDSARAPYGGRGEKTIYNFTKKGVEFLFREGASLVILACNTASSEALRKIQADLKKDKVTDKNVLGVVIPGAEEAASKTKTGAIGVLATEATVRSKAFEREIKKIFPSAKVIQKKAPLLVPLIEAGEDKSQSANLLTEKYVKSVLQKKVDTLILGCTHYGLIENMIKKYTAGVTVISEGKIVAKKLAGYLKRHSEYRALLSQGGKREFFTTDDSADFDLHGSRFYGKKIKSKKVSLD